MNIPTTSTRGKRNHPNNWTHAPERAETHCFYCGEPLGENTHKPDCVVVTRTVVLEMTVKYVVEVPRSWSEEDIYFHRNLGSNCSNNDIRTINAQLDEHENHCICQRSEIKYVREATEQDHEDMGIYCVYGGLSRDPRTNQQATGRLQ